MCSVRRLNRSLVEAALLGILFVWTSISAAAEVRWSGLQGYFDALRSFRADFVQEVRRAGSGADLSRGKVVLQKPNRFRWDYHEPYRQLVLGDGERLWHYDPDLEQATVQQLDDALAQSPLTQLMSGIAIVEIFRVERLSEDPVEAHYRLSPLGPETDFGVVELRFRLGELSTLDLEDALGQKTRVEFFNPVRNEPVPADTWDFVAPPGTDIVGDV